MEPRLSITMTYERERGGRREERKDRGREEEEDRQTRQISVNCIHDVFMSKHILVSDVTYYFMYFIAENYLLIFYNNV